MEIYTLSRDHYQAETATSVGCWFWMFGDLIELLMGILFDFSMMCV